MFRLSKVAIIRPYIKEIKKVIFTTAIYGLRPQTLQSVVPISIIRRDIAVKVIIIGIQSLGRFGQRPELSQATGVALVRCILDKFLGVVCHYFPPAVKVG